MEVSLLVLAFIILPHLLIRDVLELAKGATKIETTVGERTHGFWLNCQVDNV
jgi:hypothetical protein